jgi:sulfate transport system substrate-binding protein
VDENIAKHGTQRLARAYLQYLYSAPAQRLACRYGYRPVDVSVLGTCGSHFPRIDLANIAAFGGWKTAQERYFGENGVFDQIYQPQ